jgi:phosphoglycolate phosphatase
VKKVVIFDFDGTVADTLQTVVSVLNSLSRSFGYKFIEQKDVEDLRNKNPEEILKFLEISYFKVPFIARKATHALSSTMSELKPMPHIEASLVYLKSKGYTLGIVTSNSVKNVQTFLQSNDIAYFDFIYSCGLFRKRSVLHKLAKQFKTESSQPLIYIGDETRDVDAAKHAGMKVIAVTWGLNARPLLEQHHPDAIVDTPQELITEIKHIEENHNE